MNSPRFSFSSVIVKYGIEVFDLGFKTGSREAKVNDAAVGKSFLENELAEIAVSNDKDPLLFPGNFKDIIIRKTMRIVTRNDVNVMSEILRMRDKPELRALVE